MSFIKKDQQIKEFLHWLKKNKTNLSSSEYLKIKKRIFKSGFINIKFSKNFFDTLKYIIKYHKYILDFKNVIILLSPTVILKKFMWFS